MKKFKRCTLKIVYIQSIVTFVSKNLAIKSFLWNTYRQSMDFTEKILFPKLNFQSVLKNVLNMYKPKKVKRSMLKSWGKNALRENAFSSNQILSLKSCMVWLII